MARLVAEETQEPAERGRNPYLQPSLLLMGTGAAVTILGASYQVLHCGGEGIALDCHAGNSKGMMLTGLGVAAVGTWLYFWGESRRTPYPDVIPGGVIVRQRFSF